MNESIGIPGGVASLDSTGNVPIDQLANINTDLFIVVSELPTEDIKEGKIYCIKDTSSTAQDNGYIEYAYINNKWEKIGEFKAEPDLSDYAKLNSYNYFSNLIEFYAIKVHMNAKFDAIGRNDRKLYLKSYHSEDVSPNITYVTDGSIQSIGVPENFTFTLEDGSTVTKSIRVISTTSQAGA